MQNISPSQPRPSIAYFSMEIALESSIPTYSGGLGVLAGDTIRSAADLEVPMAAVTLLHRKGYFHQRLDDEGRQREESVEWPVDDFLLECPERAEVELEGRKVQLRAWRYDVKGVTGFTVPVYLLDADLPGNAPEDRTLTHHLYGGDARYRLCQEAILGIGGARMLRALGLEGLERYHMNEGHASLLTLELLESLARGERGAIGREEIDLVRRKCVFTTHTPVQAGHDQFPLDLVKRILGARLFERRELKDVFCCGDVLNLTYLALNLSHYVNGVAKRHREVSQSMFPRHPIDAITNGVHCATWASGPFQRLFDRHVPGWREDNFSLRYAIQIPVQEIWSAHRQAKHALLEHVNHEANAGMDQDVLTIGFARRFTAYKRPDLLVRDIGELRKVALEAGPLQVVYAGKAHPRDEWGKGLIQQVVQAGRRLKDAIRFAFLENYDLTLARLLCSGVDVWLNTPQPPLEASGTSGMKAAVNGVPSLSIADGWWLEGRIEGVTGWTIASPGAEAGATPSAPGAGGDGGDDARALYAKLREVAAIYYKERDRFMDVMRHAISINASFFNTQRMMQQYVLKAYFE